MKSTMDWSFTYIKAARPVSQDPVVSLILVFRVSTKIKFEKNEFLLNINVNISTNLLNKNCPNIANNVEVKILENNDNFTEQDWKSLYQLSEKTFVEETESLKKGAAGAGLTDND